jgi:hypothetical protein
MNKQEAIQKLRRQLELVGRLHSTPRNSPEFQKWRRDTEVAIENIFGGDTRHLRDFSSIRYTPGSYSMRDAEAAFNEAFRKGLQNAQAILSSMVEEVEEYWIATEQDAPKDILTAIERLCNRFHLVARQLRSRRENRKTLEIEDEYDVQDLLHALLKLHFDDIRPEEWTPSYAGSSSRVDFLLKQERIVIEAKKTRKGLSPKDIADQLIIDINRYQSHPDCRRLICFVYDPEGRIGNPYAIENDLTGSHSNLEVQVIIAPKGV